jgi:hypothetical protein
LALVELLAQMLHDAVAQVEVPWSQLLPHWAVRGVAKRELQHVRIQHKQLLWQQQMVESVVQVVRLVAVAVEAILLVRQLQQLLVVLEPHQLILVVQSYTVLVVQVELRVD